MDRIVRGDLQLQSAAVGHPSHTEHPPSLKLMKAERLENKVTLRRRRLPRFHPIVSGTDREQQIMLVRVQVLMSCKLELQMICLQRMVQRIADKMSYLSPTREPTSTASHQHMLLSVSRKLTRLRWFLKLPGIVSQRNRMRQYMRDPTSKALEKLILHRML